MKPLEPTEPVVGIVTKKDIIQAALEFGNGDTDATLLIKQLGFADDEDSIYVTSREAADVIFQTGKLSSQEIATSLCARAFLDESQSVIDEEIKAKPMSK